MKHIFILLTVFLAFDNIQGQTKSDPLYYLNLKQIELKKVYINTVDSIDIQKKTQPYKVYLFTRNRQFTFYSLNDILNKFTEIGGLNDSLVFKINGELINDTSSIMIDNSYFIYVTVDKLKEVNYIPGQFKNLKIVNIDLEIKKRDPVLRIRGEYENMIIK